MLRTRSHLRRSILPLILVALVCSATPEHATADTAADTTALLRGKTLLEQAVNKGSVDSLRQARSLFEAAIDNSERPALAHYYVALTNYRLNNQLPRDAEDKREPLIETGIEHLRTATDQRPEMADAWALLTGFYGQLMGMNPMRAMSLGSKADAAMKRAKTLEPKNPRVWIISGTQDFFTPSMFGGDKEQALQKFNKAVRFAEQESIDDPLVPSWGHAEGYAWIGVAHMEADRFDAARTAFENALSVNPNYGWVKHALVPKLEKESE